MTVCVIAVGAVWVVLNQAPMPEPEKEEPVKRSLAYEQAISQPREDTTKREDTADEDLAGGAPDVETVTREDVPMPQDPPAVQDIPADQAPDSQDMAALPDTALPPQEMDDEPLPWRTEGAAQWNDGRSPPDPYAGQSDPYGPPPGDQYARQGDPYGASEGDPYGASQGDPYGAPQGDPYGARQNDPYGTSQGDPYGSQGGPYGASQGDPYGSQQGDPYGSAQPDPYRQDEPYDPYAADQMAAPRGDPYGAQDQYGQTPQQQWGGQGQAGFPGQNGEEWVQVIVSGSAMRATASDEAPMLFAFPYGRDLKVVSRYGDWVEVSDPKSSATGWMQAHALGPSRGPGQQPYGQNEAYYDEQPKERPGLFQRGGFADMINRALGGGN